MLTSNKQLLEFGTIHNGDTVSETLTITNTYNVGVDILSVGAGCGCTTPTVPKGVIPPGESVPMDISFNSSGKPGMNNKSVWINYKLVGSPDLVQYVQRFSAFVI